MVLTGKAYCTAGMRTEIGVVIYNLSARKTDTGGCMGLTAQPV